MSECVVRMEMPSCCHDCPFEADQWDYPMCRVTGRSEGYRFDARNNRMVDCPIVCQLPEGHGELIERQPIIQFIEDGLNRGEYGHDQIEVMTEVFVAETIVPAERSEKDGR